MQTTFPSEPSDPLHHRRRKPPSAVEPRCSAPRRRSHLRHQPPDRRLLIERPPPPPRSPVGRSQKARLVNHGVNLDPKRPIIEARSIQRQRRHARVSEHGVVLLGEGPAPGPLGHRPLALVSILMAAEGLGAVELPVAVVARENSRLRRRLAFVVAARVFVKKVYEAVGAVFAQEGEIQRETSAGVELVGVDVRGFRGGGFGVVVAAAWIKP